MANAFLKARFRKYDPNTGDLLRDELVYSPVFNDSVSCNQAETPYKSVSPEQADALRANCTTVQPAPPAGQRASPRNCGNFEVIVTDLGQYGQPVNALPTQTVIVSSNSNLFTPAVDWSAGLARITIVPTGSIPSGQTLHFWIGGQPFVTTLPSYVWQPGDEVQIMAVVSASAYVYQGAEWTQKANFLISIGPAPTT